MSDITAISQEILTISAAPAGSQEENNTLKTGMFSRKTSCEPSLLITFTRDEIQDQDKIDYEQSPSAGSPPGMKRPNQILEENGSMEHRSSDKSLMVHQLQDKMESASVSNFRSAQMSYSLTSLPWYCQLLMGFSS